MKIEIGIGEVIMGFLEHFLDFYNSKFWEKGIILNELQDINKYNKNILVLGNLDVGRIYFKEVINKNE